MKGSRYYDDKKDLGMSGGGMDRILIPRKRIGDMEEDRDDASLSQPLSDQPRAREIGTLYREA